MFELIAITQTGNDNNSVGVLHLLRLQLCDRSGRLSKVVEVNVRGFGQKWQQLPRAGPAASGEQEGHYYNSSIPNFNFYSPQFLSFSFGCPKIKTMHVISEWPIFLLRSFARLSNSNCFLYHSGISRHSGSTSSFSSSTFFWSPRSFTCFCTACTPRTGSFWERSHSLRKKLATSRNRYASWLTHRK